MQLGGIISRVTNHQFIVTGPSTAGKSTFSYELIKKFHVQHIQIDPIIDAFQAVFPELGITHDALDHESHVVACQKFKPFAFKMLDELDMDDFVLEGFRLPLEDIHDKYPHLQYFVFGFSDTSPEERLATCRKCDVGNWTNYESDESLLKIFDFLIDESKQLEEICTKRDIPYFNTVPDYRGQIEAALSIAK